MAPELVDEMPSKSMDVLPMVRLWTELDRLRRNNCIRWNQGYSRFGRSMLIASDDMDGVGLSARPAR